ncbi:MAG: hypothetical protein NZ772_18050 [Cyanobacteria bacterium]|nr:hypothetical protein [Cyanobacteriota bacterium]MDW8203180.1 DNA-directed RNA polymerase subunit alpha C-terminal domain-containing protein [Cyanobacteriota bacterium SKYGB_h_bin112]
MVEQASIEILQLSYEAHGALRRSQIHTIADLLLYTEEDLRILNPRSADEIIHALYERLNLTLPSVTPDNNYV